MNFSAPVRSLQHPIRWGVSFSSAPAGWFLCLCLAALFAGPVSPAYAQRAFVLWVTDGDTVTVVDENVHVERIRVYGIDCPESDQPFGLWAQLRTLWEVWARPINLKPVERDRYGRLVSRVQKGDEDLSAVLVSAGLAWVYARYCQKPICSTWQDMEKRARRVGRGLWKEPAPIPPWDWRQGKRPDSGWRW